MTRSRPVIDDRTVKCPFCGRGDIEVTITSTGTAKAELTLLEGRR